MKDLEIHRMINQQVKRQGVSISQLAKRMEMTYAGVAQLLSRNQLQVNRLAELSEVLQYNFFRELAEKFPYAEPNYTDTSELDQLNEQIAELKSRVKDLELERKVLKEAISLMK